MSILKHTLRRGINRLKYYRRLVKRPRNSSRGNKKSSKLRFINPIVLLNCLYVIFIVLKQFKVNFFGTLSRIVGHLASWQAPKFLLVPLLKLYCYGYGVNLEEVQAESIREYQSFNAFFTRKLKKGCREISKKDDLHSICSPCDGTVYNFGDCEKDTFVVVKGTTYRVDEFLFGKQKDSYVRFKQVLDKVHKRGNDLKFILFYLSPADYHRYHSPAKCSTNFRRHIAGKLCPVKPTYVANHPNVFKENERVALTGEWANGFFSTTFIGATNVGSISLNFDKYLETNTTKLQGNQVSDRIYTVLGENSAGFSGTQNLENPLNGNQSNVIGNTSDSGSVEGEDTHEVLRQRRVLQNVTELEEKR